MKFITPAQLSERWQVSPQVLANWRLRGKGPPFVKLETKVMYSIAQVEAWEQRQQRGTEEMHALTVQDVQQYCDKKGYSLHILGSGLWLSKGSSQMPRRVDAEDLARVIHDEKEIEGQANAG